MMLHGYRQGLWALLCFLLLLGGCNTPSPVVHEGSAKPIALDDTVADVPVVDVGADSMPDVAAPAEVPALPGDEVLECKFVEMQWGDYAHLVVKDDAGKTRSFYLADDLPEGDYLAFEGPEHKGKRIVVRWRKVKKNIPEGGGVRSVEEAYGIELK